MMEMNVMAWIKLGLGALTLICCQTLLPAKAQTEQSSAPHQYQCPAQLQLGPNPHALRGATVFDGPIEDRASLVPESVPNESEPVFWKYEAAQQRTLHVKCIYQDTRHYIVLEAAGARQCTQSATVAAVRVQCN